MLFNPSPVLFDITLSNSFSITCSLPQLFDMLDAAHTGTLNADNLYEGLRRVDSEITREEVEAALKKLDKDGNGEIDFDEFLFHMTQGDLLEGLGGDGMYGLLVPQKGDHLYSPRDMYSFSVCTKTQS